ncbi:hypothetical protein MPSEU_001091400 [Mayamaea pseudoterrestris]|nr:hypothetical protein MPSEU_001091400 [Mayamaea pseudoterrestris]
MATAIALPPSQNVQSIDSYEQQEEEDCESLETDVIVGADENNEEMMESIESSTSFAAAAADTTTTTSMEDAASDVAMLDSANDDAKITKLTDSYAGIENLGNTCYMAASLQLLASLQDSFVEGVRQTQRDNESNGGSSKLLHSFVSVMDRLKQETTVHIDEFKAMVDEQSPLFCGYDQQDAHEFITTLLDLIDNECKTKITTKETEADKQIVMSEQKVQAIVEPMDEEPDEQNDMHSVNDVANLLLSSDWSDESATKRLRTEKAEEVELAQKDETYCSPFPRVPSVPFSSLDNDGISQLIYGTAQQDFLAASLHNQTPSSTPASPQQPRCKLVGGRMNTEGVVWKPLHADASDHCDQSSDTPNRVQHALQHNMEEQHHDTRSSQTDTTTTTDATSTAASPVDDNFVMTCRIQLTCDSCKYTRLHNETYSHLSLEIGCEGSSIEDGLRRFFAPEKLECKCEKCFADSATRSLVATTLPKCLLLHLKRFIVEVNHDYSSISYRKNRSNVAFEDALSFQDDSFLSEYLDDNCDGVDEAQLSTEYKLRSVINHIGSSASCGHYTADCKRLDRHAGDLAWYRFNDDHVRGISSTTALEESQRTAYLLLYETA